MATPRPPKILKTKEAKDLWKSIYQDFPDLDPAGKELLRVATCSLDEYLTAKATLDRDGYCFTTETGQIRKHPLVEVTKISRSAFLSAMKSLGLKYVDEPKKKTGRPLAIY